MNKKFTNVVTIREYDDGSCALNINGRDIPGLIGYDDSNKDIVRISLGVGVLSVLMGDDELPAPTPAEACEATGIPHDYHHMIGGETRCVECMQLKPAGAQKKIDRVLNTVEKIEDIVQPRPSKVLRLLRFLRHR